MRNRNILGLVLILGFATVSLTILVNGDQPNDAQQKNSSNAVAIPSLQQGKFEARSFVNATATTNRTVSMDYYGLVNIRDNFAVYIDNENETLDRIEYVLPTYVAEQVNFISFRTAINSSSSLYNMTEPIVYQYSSGANFTTYFFNIYSIDDAVIARANDTVFVEAIVELDRPYETYMVGGTQHLNFSTSLTAMLNGIKIENSSVELRVQNSGDNILVPPDGIVTPLEFLTTNTSKQLEWSNVSYPEHFNSSQLFENYTISFTVKNQLDSQSRITPGTVPLTFEKAHRIIKVDSWGTILVKETQTMVNHGEEKESSTSAAMEAAHGIKLYSVNVPEYANITAVYDGLGKLNDRDDTKVQAGAQYNGKEGTYYTEVSPYSGHKMLNVEFRNHIYGGDDVEFTIEYTLPKEHVMNSTGKGVVSHEFKIPLYSIFNMTIEDLTVDYILPVGAVFDGIDLEFTDPYRGLDVETFTQWKPAFLGRERVVRLTGKDVSPHMNHIVEVRYTSGSWDFATQWALLSSIFLLLIIVILAMQSTMERATPGTTRAKELIPSAEILKYVEYYEDHQGIQMEIEELQRKMRGRIVKKKAGDEALRKLNARLKENQEKLGVARDALTAFGKRYERMIRNVETAEATLLASKASIQSTETAYNRGKGVMSKRVYQDVLSRHRRELDGTKNSLQKHITALRQLVLKD